MYTYVYKLYVIACVSVYECVYVTIICTENKKVVAIALPGNSLALIWLARYPKLTGFLANFLIRLFQVISWSLPLG